MNQYSLMLTLAIFCLCPFLLSAQFTDEIDLILHCEDGSVYHARLVSETDDYFKVEILENYVITLSKDQVKKVMRRDDYLYYRNRRMHKTRGYFFGAHYGLGITNPNADVDNYSRQFQILLGYQFNSRFSLGFSLGLAIDDINVSGIWATKGHISPSLYGRYYLSDGGIRPFVYSQIGYGFGMEAVEANPQNGFTMQNGFGLHIASRRRTKLVLSLGHYLQRAKGTDQFFDFFNNEVQVEYKHWISRPMFKIGLEVN